MTYKTNPDGTLRYVGNKIWDATGNIDLTEFLNDVSNRPHQFVSEQYWKHITNINNEIFNATIDYFNSRGAKFVLLPLTTRLISSPGAVFGSEVIDYTEDTSPLTLEWFDLTRSTFLSESSQIYLELALLQEQIDQVYSIYNSFRKEPADETHLVEFHHIEYEGCVNQNRNEEIFIELVTAILDQLLMEAQEDLEYFLSSEKIANLRELCTDPVEKITFEQALELLREDTGDDKYGEFTQEHFGDWEEVRLTELLNSKIVCVKEYPLLEVPFYHTEANVDSDDLRVAKNSDFLWPGYKEFAGSGERISDMNEVEKKAEIFNLPVEDYKTYLEARRADTYQRTSGFGMGWERLLQGILDMPTIISVAHFPRVHTTLKP